MAVWFRGPVFESAGVGGGKEVGAVEEGFGALGLENWGGEGVDEGGREGWGWVWWGGGRGGHFDFCGGED